jgi:hypothetical protein
MSPIQVALFEILYKQPWATTTAPPEECQWTIQCFHDVMVVKKWPATKLKVYRFSAADPNWLDKVKELVCE